MTSAQDLGHEPPPQGSAPTTPPGPAPRRMDPRTWVMLFSGVVSILLFAFITMLPLPYALMRPGPVLDVLSAPEGVPLITVEGRQTYETDGTLDLLTVRVTGGPGTPSTVWDVLGGWVDPDVAVRPVDEVFPPERSKEDVDADNAQAMVTSQETATAAAMTELGISVPTTLTVVGFSPDSDAQGKLLDQDVVVSVEGTSIVDLPELREELQQIEPGNPVRIGVDRDGETQELTFATSEAEGRTVMGVFIDPIYDFPFSVQIKIEDIGGPSAGMMFALGIVDKLTPGAMTGGERIAGTGTMDSDGAVGAIGGIQQKLVGADDAGADWFLAPADNCAEVVGNVPSGLRVVRVATLAEARVAVEAIGSGDEAGISALATCSG